MTVNQHEPSAAVIKDGVLLAHCEEERYNRMKASYGKLPLYSVYACLKQAGLNVSDVDKIVVTGISYPDHDMRVQDYASKRLNIDAPVARVHHQMAHLAAAYYGSGFEKKSLCLSLDGSGDGLSGMIALGENGKLTELDSVSSNDSLGFFYSAITSFLGYADQDEYKVMGLSAYGEPIFDCSKMIAEEGAWWALDRSFVRDEPKMMSALEPKYAVKMEHFFGTKGRRPMAPITQIHKDIAASAQAHFTGLLLNALEKWKKRFPDIDHLCYGGGCALNCVTAGELIETGLFKNIFIPCHASDRGLAVGCAYLGALAEGEIPKPNASAFLGSGYAHEAILKELTDNGIRFEAVSDPTEAAASDIAEGHVVGWFQGRSESGARSLGNRSILANPMIPGMRDKVNQRIKFREAYRPFAPAIRDDAISDLFQTNGYLSPYMTLTYKTKPGVIERFPSVIHANQRARAQSVAAEDNERFHKLLSNLKAAIGAPVVLNTSFNLNGQPIVESPRDALMTFYGCGLDVLYVDNFRIVK